MPHQCTKCGKVYPDASKELLEGCSCDSRFFYYIRQEKFDDLEKDMKKVMEELDKSDKEQIEKDIRELTGLDEKPDEPVILDLESIRVLEPGKFEIDVVSLLSRNRPLIYKLGEGKYIIDLASSLKANVNDKSFETDFLDIDDDINNREEDDIDYEESSKQDDEAI